MQLFFQCPVVIVLSENDDQTWTITKTILEHYGHVVSRKEFYRHGQNKKLDKSEEAYVRELIKTKANHTNIATCLSEKTGKDVNNLVRKMSELETDKPVVEEVLGSIQDAGGYVRYIKDTDKCVDVLLIQTAEMKQLLQKEKPRLFQCDTMFGKPFL